MSKTPDEILTNTRFGSIFYRDEDVLEFPEGLIGYPDERHFVLLSTSDESPFQWLQSVDTPTLAFLVADPNSFVRDYRPFETDRDEMLLTTVSIPHGRPDEMTLNLAGPILLELGSRSGCQIVLEDEAYTTKYRVFAKAAEEFGKVAA